MAKKKTAGGKEEAKGDVVGMTTSKKDFSEWFTEIIKKAELADMRYNVKGFIVNMPWAVLCMKQMYRLFEKELERRGHDPVWFPALIPEENFKLESSHVEGFTPEVFWVTEHGAGEKFEQRLAMRPTSETSMYRMYAKWIRSWRDLPLKLYQSCQVWRYETKATRPFLRGREFHWIETHDVFATEKEATKQAHEDMQITEDIMHREFGIPFIPFQRPEWDKFAGAVHTFPADTLMPDGKAIQQPSTHLLGQNFAKPFGIKFKDKNEKEKAAWQTCYGIAIWRIMASVIAQHGDDMGLIFPFNIAPVQVMIIPIKKDRAALKKCEELKDKLCENEIRARVDYSDYTPGWKFNQWEMKGVPIRFEVGPREIKRKKITLVRRDTGKKEQSSEKNMLSTVCKTGEDITKKLIEKADKDFKSKIQSAKDMKELGQKLKQGGFVKANFCSIDRDGEACADQIKEMFHADVRGVRMDIKENPKGKCIVCGSKAKHVVYVAKQY